MQQGEIFLKPGDTYIIQVFPEKNAEEIAYYDRSSLDFNIQKSPPDSLNEKISMINELYNDFLLKNAHIQGSPGKAGVKDIMHRMNALMDNDSDQYLQDYIRYKIASLELFSRTRSNDEIAAGYLTDHPVLYQNVEYMDFFHLFFEKYLLTNNTYFPYSKTSSLINGKAPEKEILTELMKDPVLKDPRLENCTVFR